MENKGITKKQFRIQSFSSYFNLVLGLIWSRSCFIGGYREHLFDI